MEILIYIELILLIVIQAVWEVLRDQKKSPLWKYIKNIWIVQWMTLAFTWQKAQPDNWWLIPISFAVLFVALFDVCYNLFAKNKWNYESPTSGVYYKIMKPFKDLWPGYLLFILILFTYGSFIILKDLKI